MWQEQALAPGLATKGREPPAPSTTPAFRGARGTARAHKHVLEEEKSSARLHAEAEASTADARSEKNAACATDDVDAETLSLTDSDDMDNNFGLGWAAHIPDPKPEVAGPNGRSVCSDEHAPHEAVGSGSGEESVAELLSTRKQLAAELSELQRQAELTVDEAMSQAPVHASPEPQEKRAAGGLFELDSSIEMLTMSSARPRTTDDYGTSDKNPSPHSAALPLRLQNGSPARGKEGYSEWECRMQEAAVRRQVSRLLFLLVQSCVGACLIIACLGAFVVVSFAAAWRGHPSVP